MTIKAERERGKWTEDSENVNKNRKRKRGKWDGENDNKDNERKRNRKWREKKRKGVWDKEE